MFHAKIASMPCPTDDLEHRLRCRARLIRAATDVFLEEGYRASVERIAARAGVAKQTFYNNFTNKEELFREVGELLADTAAMELGLQRDDLSQTLYSFGLDFRNKNLSDKGVAIYRSFHVEGARVPEMAAAIHGRAVAKLTELLARYLNKAMKSGDLRQDDEYFAAEMLISMLIHTDRAKRLAGVPRLGATEEQQRTQKIVDCFLRAFALGQA